MTWINAGSGFTRPQYYTDAADDTEARLRAEFAAWHQLREIASSGRTNSDVVEYLARAHQIHRRWTTDVDAESRVRWQTLSDVRDAWLRDPEAARRSFAHMRNTVGENTTEPIAVRDQHQMAELTGHAEPPNLRSNQDQTRFRPTHLSLVRDTDPSRHLSAAQRALGGEATTMLTPDEVAAIIDATDDHLTVEESLGDADTGTERILALIPPDQRFAPVTTDYTAETSTALSHIGALRRLQDLYAEHVHLAEAFDGSPERGQDLIDQLEKLLEAGRSARDHAVAVGVSRVDIDAAYQSGVHGNFWSAQPGVPRLGMLAQLLEHRAADHAEIEHLRGQLEHVHAPPPVLALGSEHDALDPASSPSDTATAISFAVDAALPDSDATAGTAWAAPELTGVIEPIRPAPVTEPTI
ncbi:hypothetical protein ACFWUP_23695 [Nocardia sp. NPDC058658]|uniref:hypothetical protein n=1 Tax=Nocardia sp. NPDC058658 TaxID=3346580 RepID=UPI0036518780